jgi:hypothetical protein
MIHIVAIGLGGAKFLLSDERADNIIAKNGNLLTGGRNIL